MKLGLVTAILDQYGFEEMIRIVANMGFSCVEVACWPNEKAERRYAGVSHIDVERVLQDDDYCASLIEHCAKYRVEISALAYYPNTMDGDISRRNRNVAHLMNVIRASAKMGVNLVTTFIGRDQHKTVEENLAIVKEVWPQIITLAEELDVKIAIENCPMLFGLDQWPGGQNIMTSVDIWDKVFSILNSDHLGINYDPSHFVWQFMDYIAPIYQYQDKIFHVHFKDIKLLRKRLDRVGILAYPLDYMVPKLPGLGDVNWSEFISALTDIGYDGYACIEVEDRAFENSPERVLDSLTISKRYMEQYVI